MPKQKNAAEIEVLLDAIDRLESASAENAKRSRDIGTRARRLRRHLEQGGSVGDAVEKEEPPRIVEMISSNMAALETAGAEFRAAEAAALRTDGYTIERIAELFGVTRQRISALLRQKAAPDL